LAFADNVRARFPDAWPFESFAPSATITEDDVTVIVIVVVVNTGKGPVFVAIIIVGIAEITGTANIAAAVVIVVVADVAAEVVVDAIKWRNRRHFVGRLE
jgi:hypothetical protein